MTTRRKPAKDPPTFTVGGSFWLSGDYLPASVRTEAASHLNASPLTDAQRLALLDYASSVAQTLFNDDPAPAAEQKRQLQQLADDAARLLFRLRGVGAGARGVLHAETARLCIARENNDPELDDRVRELFATGQGREFLPVVWAWVDALNLAATAAADGFSLSRQGKLAQDQSRGFIEQVAREVARLSGRLPPKNPASWFAGFVNAITTHMGVPAGPRLIAGAIKNALMTRNSRSTQ